MQTHLGLANPTLPICLSGHGLSRYTMAAGLNASKMHGTHSRISGEWKRNKRKHSPSSPGRAVRLCLITTVIAVAKSWFISYWSLFFFFSSLWNIPSSFDSFGGFAYIVWVNVESFSAVLSFVEELKVRDRPANVGSRPWNLKFGKANGWNSEHVVCWPCQWRIITVNGLAVNRGVRMPAPQEVGCKHQMNTAGDAWVGQQRLMHVRDQTRDGGGGQEEDFLSATSVLL